MPSPHLRAIYRDLGIPADYARTRQLPVQREARTLTLVGRAADDGKPVRLTPRAAAAWQRMVAAAARDNIELLPISGYRSVARQTKIIRRKLAADERIADILRLVAAPGCSEHHTGRAIDIGSPADCKLDEHFAKTAEFLWLRKNAARFGFHLSYPRRNRHRIGYEPWHWCWRR
ncbi:MAG: D-alanyl-D-alanine carboxypeptidase family protein [Lacunisphaera sp.]|nr:D-alanyl-D-alanine carboxypeptidase family protein [Lacunisphaera sp.]